MSTRIRFVAVVCIAVFVLRAITASPYVDGHIT